MSIAIWPSVMLAGAWIAAVGAAICLLGGVAGIANNQRLGDQILWIGAPMALLGLVVFLIGFGGWWTILVVAALIGFGWLVRPPSPKETSGRGN